MPGASIEELTPHSLLSNILLAIPRIFDYWPSNINYNEKTFLEMCEYSPHEFP
jgi:hypothetical protein